MASTNNTLFAFIFFLAVGLLNAQSSRSISIINNCKQPYYFEITSGSAPTNPPTVPIEAGHCYNDAQCITGAYCDLAATRCYWKTPLPDNGNYKVEAGSSNTVTLPFINNGAKIHWSGKFAFCHGASCSATPEVCNEKGCSVLYGPSNIPEITMQKNDTDFYDISNIGGINVAVSFGPVKSQLQARSLQADAPYSCGTPGSTNGGNGVGPSNWRLTPPYQHNVYVVGDGPVCTSDKDCTGGQRCGVTNVPGRVPWFQMQCGDFYGYWTANAVCSQDPDNTLANSPFKCAQTIQNGPYLATHKGLHLCTGDSISGSGYSLGAKSDVCGCVDWPEVTNTLIPPQTEKCRNTNQVWNAVALPHLTWLKNACPSCYTYPFDDMSSTFTCSRYENNFNELDYSITLCPAE